MRLLPAVVLVMALSACARDPGVFVEANARAHVSMLADTIGSRPVGTPENARARAYIIDQLKQIGMDVRVQETDARRQEIGLTARVSNIIAALPGERPEAVAVIAHYDSSPDAPGASDDGFGVGVAIEVARQFASRPSRRWTLFVILTDGEESGLLGAAALVNDRHVMERLQAYVNVESIGSAGVPILFETGPGNAWIVSPWARRAPHPRGGSFALEIYRRLPNDTDFSILKTRGIPGLNFAVADDSYAYHTARDTVDRLAHETIRTAGENVLAILDALQETDITQRNVIDATYFDIAGVRASSYGTGAQWMLALAALVVGFIAWVRLTGDSVRENGFLRWLLMLVWAWFGAAATIGAMVLATWLLRAAREVYHPWYARPGRLFFLLLVVGAAVAWGFARLGQWLPRRAHPVRHPVLTWSVALPAWLAVSLLAFLFAPAAAYLFVLPLLAAGALLVVVPPRFDAAVRVVSVIVLAVAGTLWVKDTRDLLHFLVTVMGRFPIITPAFVYAALIAVAGLMVAPPFVAAIASERRLLRPWVMTSVLLLACAIAAGAAYLAPAYTREQPLRRVVRVLQDDARAASTALGAEPAGTQAIWEVASVEPGLDLAAGAPDGWRPVGDQVEASLPWGRLPHPFVFRTTTPAIGPAPASVTGFTTQPLADGIQLTVNVSASVPGVAVSFVLPEGILPVRSSLPGAVRSGHWVATYVAPPLEGIAWEASFRQVPLERLRETKLAVTSSRLPGGSGWQSLPDWLPQDSTVWSANASWILPAAIGTGIAPVPPLR